MLVLPDSYMTIEIVVICLGYEKFGIISVAILSNSGLGISFLLHVSKQWDSSSISPLSQFSHILSCKGIFGDSCLPVSMFRLWEITLNLAILLYVFLGRFYTVWFKILSIYIRETCVFIDMYMCLFSPGLSCIFIFYIFYCCMTNRSNLN